MAIEPRGPAHAGGPQTSTLADDWQRAKTEARGVGSAVAGITEELRVLLRREGDLATAEVADAMHAARQAGLWGGLSALLGAAAMIFAGLAVMFALTLVVELWAAASLTAAIFVVCAAVAALITRRYATAANPVPKRTWQSIREDVRWAGEQIARRSA